MVIVEIGRVAKGGKGRADPTVVADVVVVVVVDLLIEMSSTAELELELKVAVVAV